MKEWNETASRKNITANNKGRALINTKPHHKEKIHATQISKHKKTTQQEDRRSKQNTNTLKPDTAIKRSKEIPSTYILKVLPETIQKPNTKGDTENITKDSKPQQAAKQ
ncbi:hypothetical protein HMPREF9447_00042 [Bacteroides oleiciplenus YIT 12058]|uniref:Uncharacterized protein n=1 Tax=Bacteroides oleiciplenus YIT 12058 TaxID=742727 RepID=K9ETB8_9BACE|nr:hypothetical protein HMPREF9447_00042 [Bacteroides oleiciplenus YIT 12058]